MVKIIALAETAAVDLEELMRYRLTEICLPPFNVNGQMRKAVKSTLVSSFEMHETTLEGVSYISIIDMDFIWRLATPSTADRESAEGDFTWRNYQKRNSMFVGGSRNIFPSSNLTVPPARKFNSFFENAENKIRLQDFLFKELTEFAKTHQKTFVYTLKE